MNIKALRAFCLVMNRGSLAGAAEELNLSQPAVSRLVSGLEGHLRLTLFHRDRRTLRPTPEARAFYREASRILSGIETLPEIAREIRDGERTQLRIVVMARLATALVVPAVKRFNAINDKVALTVEMHHRRDMERWLAGRQFDLGFGPLPVNTTALTSEAICALPALAVFAPDHPLAAAEAVTVAQLAAEPLIALTPDTLLQQQIEAIFSHAGKTPLQGTRTSSSLVACSLAALGLGYTITDPFVLASVKAPVVGVPIEPLFAFEFGALWPRDGERPEAAEQFKAVTQGLAEEMAAAWPRP